MKADRNRTEIVLNWLVGIACVATLVGFSALFAQGKSRSEPRSTHAITIGIGTIAIDGMQNEWGYDPVCHATVDRKDRLLVTCRKDWEIDENLEMVEYDPKTIFEQTVPGLFEDVFDRVGLAREFAIYKDWIETFDWADFDEEVVRQPKGQWVENGRTRLHYCRKPIEIIPDLPVWTRYHAYADARPEVAEIKGCDDQFTNEWRSGVAESAEMIRDIAGLEEGTGPLIL